MPLSTLVLKSLGLTMLLYAVMWGGLYLLAKHFGAEVGTDYGFVGHLLNAAFFFVLTFGIMHMPPHRRILGVATVFLLVMGSLVYIGSQMSQATKVNAVYLD